jgi:hypothetical protein
MAEDAVYTTGHRLTIIRPTWKNGGTLWEESFGGC